MDIIKKAEISQQREIEMLKHAQGTSQNNDTKNNSNQTSSNDNSAEDTDSINTWPDAIHDTAFYGLAGEIIKLIEPHTESDSVALLVNFLTAFGNIVGDKVYFKVEGDKHPGRLFCVLTGETAKGRKGTSWGHIRNIFTSIDEFWKISTGLSSGEGLIWAIRDAIKKGEEILDEGVQDKRLLVVESEFASILRVVGREGNTLSPNIRNAWDNGNLQSLTKNSPAIATGAHISILGHVTRNELLKYLSDTEKANGFGNRFLWLCVKRSKSLPFGGEINTQLLEPLVEKLRSVIAFADSGGEIRWADETRLLWQYIYTPLSDGKPGLLGSMIARAEAHVVRLSCIYALLDKSLLIKPEHLKAALAVWDYAEDSARYIFQDMTGSELADEILKLLAGFPEGISKTDISKEFGGHKTSLQLTEALGMLQGLGLVENKIEPTDGRNKEIWYLKQAKDNQHNSLNSQGRKSYLKMLEDFIVSNK